ncbi:BON domain-containing protein [Marinicella sp. W31]|uniref:BON domain-containing protein n=1 Tax=Marinicella sp. W31 TaxID=3023713 RepID=UPI0037572AEB
MMKRYILPCLLVCSTLLLQACAPVIVGGAVVTGISVVHDRRTAGQVLDDKIITSAVKSELRKTLSDDRRIKVAVYNGVVLLAGQVVNPEDRIVAEDAAAIKDGVLKVVNELKVAEDIPGLGSRTEDRYISSKAKSSLFNVKIKGFDPTRVNVTTVDNEVYLMGLVTREEADAVVEKIRNLRGVLKVIKVFEYVSDFE